MRVILTVISCSVALLLVQHLAQCCPGLAVCAAIASVFMYLYIQGMDLGYKTPGFFKKNQKTRGTRAGCAFSQVFSTNVVYSWMIISYPFAKLSSSL